MGTLVLVRHGRTRANADGVLVGRTPGIDLDAVGRSQAGAAAERLRHLRVDALVCSPLERTRQTAGIIGTGHAPVVAAVPDERLLECDYGSWTGRPLAELTTEPLWHRIRERPSEAVFPDGEAMLDMRERAVEASRDWLARLGAEATVVLVTHADLVKAILADVLGMPFDGFQRIEVDPGSISVIRTSPQGSAVLAVNLGAVGLPGGLGRVEL